MSLGKGSVLQIAIGDYRGTKMQVVSEPYRDKFLNDTVYLVTHSYGFQLFISESEIRSGKYRLIKKVSV